MALEAAAEGVVARCTDISEAELDGQLTEVYRRLSQLMEEDIGRQTGCTIAHSRTPRWEGPRLVKRKLLQPRRVNVWEPQAAGTCWLRNRLWELCHICDLDDFELQSVSMYDLIDAVRDPPVVMTGEAKELHTAFDTLLTGVEVGQLNEVKAQLAEMLEAVAVAHMEAQRVDQLDSQKRWQLWAKSALQGGGGRAHRWARLPPEAGDASIGQGYIATHSLL